MKIYSQMSQIDIGKSIEYVTTPALLVDHNKVVGNCLAMQKTCQDLGLKLRAQTKTHKSIEGVRLQVGDSLRGLVTSTLKEAEYFAGKGCDDILYGYPLLPIHMDRVNRLTRDLKQFHVMIDNGVALKALLDNCPPEEKKWSVFVKVDCGNKRAGIWWEDTTKLVELCQSLVETPTIQFQGLYAHCGDTYDPEGTISSRDHNIDRIIKVRDELIAAGIAPPTVGIGSTPSCSRPTPKMSALTELHPGNYIFYDLQQMKLGSCSKDNIACKVATRVLGHYPHRNEMLVDCGFTALTKQGFGEVNPGYGEIENEPNLCLYKMTQEIGFIKPMKGNLDFSKYPIGSLLFVLPWHSCATAAMYPFYHIVKDGAITEYWQPAQGW